MDFFFDQSNKEDDLKNLIGLFDAVCDVYDRTDFKPRADGETFCNQAVHAVASAAFKYNGFYNLKADEIVETMDGDDWVVIDIIVAQQYANAGSLVVAGLRSSDLGQAHGHVVVIRPGIPCDSGKWGPVPRCLNIGANDFLARGQTGALTGMSVGVNEAFIPKPKFYVLRSSL